MTDDNQYYRRDPRITFESVLLLVIFIGAALFVAALAYKMAPWEGDSDEPLDTTVAETQAGDAAGASGDEIVEGGEESAP